MSIELVRNTLAIIANGKKTVKAHRLTERIAKRAKISNAESRQAMSKILQVGDIECEWVAGEPFGDVKVLLPVPEKVRIREEWREEIGNHTFLGSTKKLSAKAIQVNGRSHAEVLGAFEKLRDLKDSGFLLREVSTRLFWGLSKVLDSKEHLVAELLGLDECPFPEKPISILVHMPDKVSKGVLFIENEVSFLAACQGRLKNTEGYVFLYASGYKSGTPRLRKKNGAAIFFSSSSSHSDSNILGFNEWLFDGLHWSVYFWGDLDFSGMDILAKLKKVFPTIESWFDGYVPMLNALQAGDGHSPEEAKKENQKDPIETGCAYADLVLLPALRKYKRFLDQE